MNCINLTLLVLLSYWIIIPSNWCVAKDRVRPYRYRSSTWNPQRIILDGQLVVACQSHSDSDSTNPASIRYSRENWRGYRTMFPWHALQSYSSMNTSPLDCASRFVVSLHAGYIRHACALFPGSCILMKTTLLTRSLVVCLPLLLLNPNMYPDFPTLLNFSGLERSFPKYPLFF